MSDTTVKIMCQNTCKLICEVPYDAICLSKTIRDMVETSEQKVALVPSDKFAGESMNYVVEWCEEHAKNPTTDLNEIFDKYAKGCEHDNKLCNDCSVKRHGEIKKFLENSQMSDFDKKFFDKSNLERIEMLKLTDFLAIEELYFRLCKTFADKINKCKTKEEIVKAVPEFITPELCGEETYEEIKVHLPEEFQENQENQKESS